MKIKTRPRHGGMLQMDGWSAGLQDGESARPCDPADAEPWDLGPGGVDRAGRGYPPLGHAELEWHHEYLEWHRDYRADEAHSRWQISRGPRRYVHSPAVAVNPARVWRPYTGGQSGLGQDSEHGQDL